MMILDRVKAWVKSIPEKRGREAVKAYGLVALALFLFGGSLSLLYNYVVLPRLSADSILIASGSGKPNTPQEARDIPGPINGVLFTATEAKLWQNRRTLAVVIENHTDARPQSGLSEADAVYEALAEGGITRYLALYLTTKSEVTLGPVRSMRTYFLDWLEEYDSLAVHIGGNIDALDRIGPEKVKDLDQFGLGSPTYIRTSDRFAPHNVYTTTSKLWDAANNRGFSSASTFHSWSFKDEATVSARPSAQILRLGFLGAADYKVVWTYDSSTNAYLRSVGGAADVDRNTNNRVTAKTIVVEIVPMQTGVTRISESTIVMSDTGTGKAKVFTDGVEQDATWTKASRTDRTTLTDSAGKEIPFNRGSIWIEVVPPASAIDF